MHSLLTSILLVYTTTILTRRYKVSGIFEYIFCCMKLSVQNGVLCLLMYSIFRMSRN